MYIDSFIRENKVMANVYKHAHLLIKSSLICQLFFIFIMAVNMQLYLGVHFLGNSKMLPSNQRFAWYVYRTSLSIISTCFFFARPSLMILHHPLSTPPSFYTVWLNILAYRYSTPFIYAQPYHKWTSVLWWSLTFVREYLKLLKW